VATMPFRICLCASGATGHLVSVVTPRVSSCSVELHSRPACKQNAAPGGGSGKAGIWWSYGHKAVIFVLYHMVSAHTVELLRETYDLRFYFVEPLNIPCFDVEAGTPSPFTQKGYGLSSDMTRLDK
jgi:hypothetical protein